MEWHVLPGRQSLLTCEEGQGGGVNDGELGSRVIPSPLELEEGHRCWRTLDLGQCSRAMGKGILGNSSGVWGGGGGGWDDEVTHRNLHVIGAFIILFVQHLKVVPEGG